MGWVGLGVVGGGRSGSSVSVSGGGVFVRVAIVMTSWGASGVGSFEPLLTVCD